MNILIINQPPYNRGDESAHKALLRSLISHYPNIQIRVLSFWGWGESNRQYSISDSRVKYIYPSNNFFGYARVLYWGLCKGYTCLWNLHPSFFELKKNYKWSDFVICAPGGICMGGFQDWNHVFYLKLAKFYSKPLVYYGRSFGPFPIETESNRAFKRISIEMLNYFSFLSIRDRKTEMLAEEIAVPYVSTVDSAFLDSPKVDIPYELKQNIGDNPYMVFVPNYLLWHYSYKNRISHETVMNFYIQVIDTIWQCNPEINIVMLPQLFCGDKYALNDVHFFRELAELKSDNRIIVTADCYSSDIQQSIINGAKYVIGARYHSIVFAINQGVPCIALSYEHKIAGLLETLGKSEWCVDFTQTLDKEENQEKCLSEIRRLIPLMKPDNDIRDRAKQIANNCMDKFVQWINKNESSFK